MKTATTQMTDIPLVGFPSLEGNAAVPVYDDFAFHHRKRLRERFMKTDGAAMPDYELLELVLFRAIALADVKPIAQRLLRRFGDFNRVLSAPAHQLKEVDGVTEAVIEEFHIVEVASHRMAQAKVLQRDVLTSWDDLMSYCKTVMAHRHTEQFRVLYLDAKNILIADESQGTGTIDHVPVYPREIAKRALELDSSAVILVHNHPSGNPAPSDEDMAMTYQIETALVALGITVHDHVVIGKGSDFSFRANGLLS